MEMKGKAMEVKGRRDTGEGGKPLIKNTVFEQLACLRLDKQPLDVSAHWRHMV